MRKSIILLAILMLSARPALAYSTPLHKLYSGVKKVVTGPFSILTVPAELMRSENNKALGLAGGLMEGAVQSAVKPLEGVLTILTFPFVDHEFKIDEE